MTLCKALCAISVAVYSSICLAQSITDVEAKPYGSYTGGAIDTVDLATGNLMLNIPLVSFPQRGALPPLSFSIELNNAPYSQTGWTCDPNGQVLAPQNSNYEIVCGLLSSRYDTSPPGAAYLSTSTINNSEYTTYLENDYVTQWTTYAACYANQNVCGFDELWGAEDDTQLQNIGAYITSSFEGGIVTGQESTRPNGSSTISEYDYSFIDPSGTTHELVSDASSWNTFRATDGSGWAFVPSGPANSGYDTSIPADGLDYFTLSNQVWIGNPPNATSGVRVGTLYSPTGIQYKSTINVYPAPPSNENYAGPGSGYYPYYTPRALISTATDPSGNTITRGPWYWSGYQSEGQSQESVYNDIGGIYAGLQPPAGGYTPGPYYKDSVGRIIPDVVSMQATQYGWVNLGSSRYALTWQVPGPGGNPVAYIITYIPISNNITWSAQGQTAVPDPSTNLSVNGWAISSIQLPNGTKWTFTYSNGLDPTSPDGIDHTASAGDLKQITTPTGGTISYTYAAMTAGQAAPVGLGRCNAVCHAVQSRTETDGLPGHSWTTNYTYGVYSADSGCGTVFTGSVWVSYGTTTTVSNPDGSFISHLFCALTEGPNIPIASQYHETQTSYGNPGASVKSVYTSYDNYQVDMPPQINPVGLPGLVNVYPTQILTSSGGSSYDMRQYSTLFNATRIQCGSECFPKGTYGNYVSIPISYLAPTTQIVEDSANNPLRTTTTTFNFQNHNSPTDPYWVNNLVALPASVQVSGAAGETGTTTYGYDENNGSPQGPFGNLTSKAEAYALPNSSGGMGSAWSETSSIYNSYGMPTSHIDANGNAPGAVPSQHTTTITYDSTNLFANKIQRPTTNGIQHIDYYSYDANTGNLNWHTDENGSGPQDVNHTTTYGHDIMGRITSIQYPDGGGTTFCYTDIGGSIPGCGTSPGTPPFSLYTSTAASPDPPVLTKHSYDAWGRQYQSQLLSDPLGPVIVDTTYDFEGKVTLVSNPYRNPPTSGGPAPGGSDPPTGNTSYAYDVLGRKTMQTQPDGSIQQWCYENVASTRQTNCSPLTWYTSSPANPLDWIDVSDETGRRTQQAFDALGNLVAVTEPDPVSGSLDLSNGAAETDYYYDGFNDLVQVNQNGLWRQFYYDLPSRVIGSCNPEVNVGGWCGSGSGPATSYVYDYNSNLTQKTDNGGITTNYAYDGLNRLLSKTYSNDPNGTASSCYQYDGAPSANLRGRQAAQWTQAGACPSSPPVTGVITKAVMTGYDQMGRLLSEQRCMGIFDCAGGGYGMSYTYDLAGKLASYLSGIGGFSFTNAYDASGHLLTFNASQGSQPTPTPLFSQPFYTPAGALKQLTLGTSINMIRTYDSRQRVTSETNSGGNNGGTTSGRGAVTILGSEQSY